jgi:hypothetical protein
MDLRGYGPVKAEAHQRLIAFCAARGVTPPPA